MLYGRKVCFCVSLNSFGFYLFLFLLPSENNILLTLTHNDRSDAEILGPNNQYLPKIISVFAEVLLHSVSAFHIIYKEMLLDFLGLSRQMHQFIIDV